VPESPADTEKRIDDTARAFHEAYERLAPALGYETRKATAVPWEEVPEANRRLMRAVVAELDLVPASSFDALSEEHERVKARADRAEIRAAVNTSGVG
jgi:BMFP domain-containing protein YqiC